MLLRNKETGEEFHAPSGLGKALIATGAVEEVLPLPAPVVEVQWTTSRGQVNDGYQHPPVIFWTGGGNSGYHASTDGTSHLKLRSYVPGQRQSTCPRHIADEYLRLFADWSSRRKKPAATAQTPHVSAHTPKIPGVGPYTGATVQPWRRDFELRGKKS